MLRTAVPVTASTTLVTAPPKSSPTLDEQAIAGGIERPPVETWGDEARDRSGTIETPPRDDRFVVAEGDELGATAG